MISRAKDIWRDLNRLLNVDDAEFVLNLQEHHLELKEIENRLKEVFRKDHKSLKSKSNFKGLNVKYSKLEKDIQYRISQAFLHVDDIKQDRKEQFVCVVARSIICEKVALSHLDKLSNLIAELVPKTSFLKDGKAQLDRIKEFFEIGRNVDRIKGYGREAYLAIDDYCHFYDLANHLMGEKAELYGKRFKADVYSFQLDSAIKELSTSRTESCDAAPFLIRSRLEITIRRLMFNTDFMVPTRYTPTSRLSISELLKSCKRNGIQFNYSYDTLEVLIENLNLVVHFGFKLNSALLWYTFFVTTNLKLSFDKSMQDEERKEILKKRAIEVFKDLESRGFVQKAEETNYFKKPGINIFWRY